MKRKATIKKSVGKTEKRSVSKSVKKVRTTEARKVRFLVISSTPMLSSTVY